MTCLFISIIVLLLALLCAKFTKDGLAELGREGLALGGPLSRELLLGMLPTGEAVLIVMLEKDVLREDMAMGVSGDGGL